MKQPGFFDVEDCYKALSDCGDPLEVLAEHIPWESFRYRLNKALKRSAENKTGRPPFDAVMMFKILVLQSLDNLSDERMEFLIRDRLTFRRFLGLGLEGRVPDAKTIWLFRENLTQVGVIDKLFDLFGRHLDERGLRATGGQLVDASFVHVPVQRNSREENKTIKAGEVPEEWLDKPAKLRQKDTDARWTKKNNVSHYGYKNHINADRKHKLIRKYDVTSAAPHDSQRLEAVLEDNPHCADLWADSAYRSAEMEDRLKQRGLRSHIHTKGARGKPLSEAQKRANKRRSKVRARGRRGQAAHISQATGMSVSSWAVPHSKFKPTKSFLNRRPVVDAGHCEASWQPTQLTRHP